MRIRYSNAVLYVVLLLFIAFTASIFLQLELPKPTGPYAVGRTIFRWADTSRPEVLTDDPNDVREVMALVWYPAVPGTGRNAVYFPNLPVVADELAASGEVASWQVLGLRWVRTNSYLDAQPVTDKDSFPIVILAPGNGTNIEFYSALASEIASHGYIVVGVNHPYDVAAVELSDGHVAPYDKEQWSMDAEAHQRYIAERHPVKVADMLFVLDQLTLLNSNANSPFAGILDLDSVAAAGHSLGGIVASDACKADARFTVCINFDGLQKGGPFSMDETAAPPSQPFLFLTKESELHPKLIQSFESTSESYWVVVQGASHDSFTDGPLLQPSLSPAPKQADLFMGLIQRYTLAFLDQTLKGRVSTLLSKPVEESDISVRIFPTQ